MEAMLNKFLKSNKSGGRTGKAGQRTTGNQKGQDTFAGEQQKSKRMDTFAGEQQNQKEWTHSPESNKKSKKNGHIRRRTTRNQKRMDTFAGEQQEIKHELREIKRKVNIIYEQTANLTEFGTEITQRLTVMI